MKKLSKVMSFCLAASMLVVTGCEKGENKVQVNETIEQLEEAPEVTEKEAKKIVRKSVDAIANAFSEMEKENGWSRNNPGDLATAKKGVKGLVSDKFVEKALPGLLDTFNRSRETDMLPFPIHIEPDVRTTYSQKNDVLKIETLTLANDMGNEAEMWEFVFVYTDGKWLMDRWSSNTPVDLKLTKEEAKELLRVQGFKNVSFVREENSGNKKYIFKESNEVVAVDAKNSVIAHNVDDEEQEKVTKKDFVQEQETVKGNDASTSTSSKKETSSAVGKTKVLNELAALENEEKHTNVMSTNDIVNEIEGNYQLWDNKLNEIYSTLKNTMSADAFQSLKTKQVAWVKEKESKVKAIATDENNGTMKYIEAADEKYKMTKERCY
ncbi:lysozyme inhibitor LprI family protein, partial [Bacillus wiedmannii]|uniref:lysozyme inhibitor LprI family protein n=1 Tax=Bacillus wiedmannii TaxID=1890302 RepID=UPI0034D57F3D